MTQNVEPVKCKTCGHFMKVVFVRLFINPRESNGDHTLDFFLEQTFFCDQTQGCQLNGTYTLYSNAVLEAPPGLAESREPDDHDH